MSGSIFRNSLRTNAEKVLRPNSRDKDTNSLNQRCYICNQSFPEPVKVPKCSTHVYCLNCVTTKKKKDVKKCKQCANFFVGNEGEVEKNKCNLCNDKAKEFIKFSDEHKYCNHCAEFLKTNNLKAYRRIFNCLQCTESIFKWAQIYSPDYILYGTVENQIAIEKEIEKEIAKNLKFKTSPRSKELIDSKANEIPKISNDEGYESIYNKDTQSKFAEQNRLRDDYLPEIKANEDLEDSKLLYRSYVFIKSKCFLCQKPDEIKSFECNHNICLGCLSNSCFTEIQNFFSTQANDPSIFEQKFWYHCPICQTKISVPTMMILKKMNQDIPSYLYYIPYLDGIPFI